MFGFEPRTSGVGSDYSANCSSTTAPTNYKVRWWLQQNSGEMFQIFFLQSFASETKLWFTFRPQEKNSIFFFADSSPAGDVTDSCHGQKNFASAKQSHSLLRLRCTMEKLRKARGRLFVMVFWWHYVNSPTDNSSPDNSSPLFIPHRGFWGACPLVRA